MVKYGIIGEGGGNAGCLECGTEIYGGRSDKKFCSEVCKNRYNNRKTQNLRNLKLRIRTIVERNHEILSALLREKVYSIERDELRMMGFNPEFVTSHAKAGRHDHCCCYDIAYVLTPTKISNIRRLKAMERFADKRREERDGAHK